MVPPSFFLAVGYSSGISIISNCLIGESWCDFDIIATKLEEARRRFGMRLVVVVVYVIRMAHRRMHTRMRRQASSYAHSYAPGRRRRCIRHTYGLNVVCTLVCDARRRRMHTRMRQEPSFTTTEGENQCFIQLDKF